MTPLLVTLPTHPGDIEQSETLVKWIVELGPVRDHSLLIGADSEIPQERVKALMEIARPAFHNVRAMSINVGVKGWPLAANLTFRAVARQVYELCKLPWLLLEPDSIPLRADWLNMLADEYSKSPKPFMGSLMDNESAAEGLPKKYLSAIGIYPQNAYVRLGELWKDARFTGPVKPAKMGVAQFQSTVRAYDMIAAEFLVPRAQHTNLIHSHWGPDYNTPPLFVPQRTEASPPNAVTVDFIKKDAVLFHRVKAIEDFLALWRVRMGFKEALAAETGKGLERTVITPEMVKELAATSSELPKIESPAAPPKRRGNPNWQKKQREPMAMI